MRVAEDLAEDRWALLVFYTADGLRCFAGEFGGSGDGSFDETDLVDQAFIERLLGGEDLAGGDGVKRGFVVFEFGPAGGDDCLKAFEAVVYQPLHNLAF